MKARRAVALALASVSLFVTAIAVADEAPSPTAAPPLPAAPVSLTVTAGEGGAWKLRIENTGELPVRVAADVGLLTLEIQPPVEAKKRGARGPVTVRCAFGRGSRPDNDDDSALVVPGKKSWSAAFDPRRLCFSARDRAALVAGAIVTGHFGFPERKRPAAKRGAPPPTPSSPFAVTPVGAGFGKLLPIKELSARPFALAPSSIPSPPDGPKVASDEPRLELGITPYVDSERGRAIDARVTLVNRSSRNVALLFRASTITFDVDGPKGHVACDRPPKAGTPIRELYTRLAPGGRTAMSLLLDAKCPAGTFAAPGIYRVRALLDTRDADGFEAGLTTFNGEVTGGEAIVRVREWQNEGVRTKPALD